MPLKLTRRQSLTTLLAGLLPVLTPHGAMARTPLRIGMIGSGHVGSTLGQLWSRAGHEVMLSALTLREAQERVEELHFGSAGTSHDAAAFGDVVVLAVPYGALQQLGHTIGPILNARPLIDATNPYTWRDGKIGRQALLEGAGMVTQSLFPTAAVVRAFNSEDMTTLLAQSNRPPPRMALPMAGDVARALTMAGWLIHDAGFDPVMAGGLSAAGLFQPGGPAFEARMDADDLRRLLGVTGDSAVERSLAARFAAAQASGGR